jgi:hypothetical protein
MLGLQFCRGVVRGWRKEAGKVFFRIREPSPGMVQKRQAPARFPPGPALVSSESPRDGNRDAPSRIIETCLRIVREERKGKVSTRTLHTLDFQDRRAGAMRIGPTKFK